MINLFYKDYLDKLTTIFIPINITPPILRPLIKSSVEPTKFAIKQKYNHLAKKKVNKWGKNGVWQLLQ